MKRIRFLSVNYTAEEIISLFHTQFMFYKGLPGITDDVKDALNEMEKEFVFRLQTYSQFRKCPTVRKDGIQNVYLNENNEICIETVSSKITKADEFCKLVSLDEYLRCTENCKVVFELEDRDIILEADKDQFYDIKNIFLKKLDNKICDLQKEIEEL